MPSRWARTASPPPLPPHPRPPSLHCPPKLPPPAATPAARGRAPGAACVRTSCHRFHHIQPSPDVVGQPGTIDARIQIHVALQPGRTRLPRQHHPPVPTLSHPLCHPHGGRVLSSHPISIPPGLIPIPLALTTVSSYIDPPASQPPRSRPASAPADWPSLLPSPAAAPA